MSEYRVQVQYRKLDDALLPDRWRLSGAARQAAVHVPVPVSQLAAAPGGDADPGRLWIHGPACAYNKPVDRGYGRWLELLPGCFADQVPHATQVKVLWQHEDARILGRLEELTDSATALAYRGWVTRHEQVTEAANAAALLELGLLDEVSVGFRILKYQQVIDDEADTVTYRVEKGHLEEVSLVTWGAMGRDATATPELSAKPDAAVLHSQRVRALLAAAGAR